MPSDREYIHEAQESRRRGLAPIGFRIVAPDGIALTPLDPVGQDRPVLRAEERRGDGRLVGSMELGVFAARMMIDRDGVLAKLATVAAEHALAPPFGGRIESIHEVELTEGVIGCCAEVVLAHDESGQPRPPCPYVDLYALTSDVEVGGGVTVTVRHAAHDWPAGKAMLNSLQIRSLRGGSGTGRGADGSGGSWLPLVGRR